MELPEILEEQAEEILEGSSELTNSIWSVKRERGGLQKRRRSFASSKKYGSSLAGLMELSELRIRLGIEEECFNKMMCFETLNPGLFDKRPASPSSRLPPAVIHHLPVLSSSSRR